MKKNKLWIIAGAMLLICAAMFTLFLKPLLTKDKYVYKETVVEFGDLVLGIQESGSLECKTESISYDIEIEDDSDEDSDSEDEEEDEQYLRVEEVYAAQGQDVSKGDALLKFTDASVIAVRKKLERILTEAEVSYIEAQKEYNVGLANAQGTYESSILGKENSETVYQAQQSAANAGFKQLQQKLTVLQGEIDELKEQLEDGEFWQSYKEAERKYNAAKENLEDVNQNSPAAYNARYTAYTQAKNTFEMLQKQVDEINESIDDKQHEMVEVSEQLSFYNEQYQKEKQSAEHTKEIAQSNGEYAETIYGYTIEALEDAVTAAEHTRQEAEEELTAFDEFVGSNNIIYAKEDGKIIAIMYEAGDKILRTGDLLTYRTGKEETITVNLAEEDVVNIQVGDSVSIEFTAYPDEIYEGVIKRIETKTTDAFTSTVNYPVTLLVLGDTSKLYEGMSADVTFAVESRENVLYVSKKAIVEQNEDTYVYIENSVGQKELTEVKTGFSNGIYIEIQEGLSKGDVVYIASKVSSELEVSD